jgi:hypothetical protein
MTTHTQQYDNPTFEEYLSETGTMVREDNGVSASYLHEGKLKFVRYSWAELDALDPRLATVVKHMFDSDIYYVSSTWVNNTLAYWKNPVPLLDNKNNEHAVESVATVLMFNRNTEMVRLVTIDWELATVGDITYATRTKDEEYMVTSDELDKKYPGWKTRYDVLTSLETSQRELMDGVFNSVRYETAPHEQLDNVSFE